MQKLEFEFDWILIVYQPSEKMCSINLLHTDCSACIFSRLTTADKAI